MSRLQRILFWLSFIGLAAASCWGIYSAQLFSQPIWSPIGLRRLLLFSGAYVVWCALVIGFARRWFVLLTSIAALAWTAVSAGVQPVAAAGLFLLSSAVIGRLIRRDANLFLSVVLGTCVLASVIGAAVYFPINYPVVYLVLFVAPLTIHRVTAQGLKDAGRLFRPVERDSGMDYASALLGFALLPELLISLNPETSPDALGMHLFIPWSVYFKHAWSFDFQHIAWALMPMGADWCFTGVFLLGGESAVKLLNFGMLVILSGLVYSVVRHWLPRGPALVVAALFASSPLAMLVTGSVFVENIQAAFLFGALIALWEFRTTGARLWLFSAAALLGSGMATKFGSLAFVAPFVVLAGAELWRRRREPKQKMALVSAAAAGIFLLFALPPYVTAHVKSGNPLFPFLNHIFKSPAFDSRVAFLDGRWRHALGAGTPFDVVFHTHRYFEGSDGALGFQYLLLVPLCVLLLGRRSPYFGWAALGIGVPFVLLTFSAATYVRYLYVALPLASVLIGLILARLHSSDKQLYITAFTACVICQLANVYFLAASSSSHRDFFLNPFAPEEARAFDRDALAVRGLVRHLNADYPNEAVAMFETAQVAGLRGDAYLDDWHYFSYSRRVHQAPSALGYLRVVQELGIRHFIAPQPGGFVSFGFIESFLAEYTEPEYSYGGYRLTRLKQGLAIPSDAEVAASLPAPNRCAVDPERVLDDLDSRIHYSGSWAHEIIYPAAFRSSISYAEAGRSALQISFSGTEVTWVYTQAPNRGQADVEIDDARAETVDLYAPVIHWQAASTFRTSPGAHVLRIKVRGSKTAASSGSYVDLDCVVLQ